MYIPFSKLLKAGLLVGTLDISAAFLNYYIRTGKNPLRVLTYIASGIFGKAAYEGGSEMLIAGLVLHYMIAFTFTLFFFWLFARMKGLAHWRLLTGILYGLFVWLVMNLVVVPLSSVTRPPFRWDSVLINIGILMVCIGIPLSIIASKYYQKQAVVVQKQ